MARLRYGAQCRILGYVRYRTYLPVCYFVFSIPLHICRLPLRRRERGLLMKGEEIQAEMIPIA